MEPPLVRTQRDLVRSRAFLRYRDPLRYEHFDRLVEDRPSSEFFLGVHYPRPWPLSTDALDDLTYQIVNFVTRFSCALDDQSQRVAVSRWGRASPEIERAAVDYVTSWLSAKRYRVHTREPELCGYDLLAVSDLRELHVEVKGSAGEQRFFLTRNEWATAHCDPLWRLYLVMNAVTMPEIRRYTCEGMKRRFIMEPTQWYARPRADGL
ncbi:DUF3883 domain-containing protein [Sorangium sp. So ce385]|uniref:DUF3883 domain-containing protein n=1 Tax=Sorangium sp. So ce385 TaxID=3133308 RepID=UPI003F5B45A6